MKTKFAVVITTYKRSDGRTPELLTRALESVKSQTHEDWKVFLMGDKYEDDEEFKKLASILDSDKIKAVNREVAAERDIYPKGSMQLWCAGGNASSRAGIQLALDEGFEYVCYLDHDDFWAPGHLMAFNDAIEKHPDLFVLASRSFYLNNSNILPRPHQKAGYGYIPLPEQVVKSSLCLKWSETEIRARDVFKETGKPEPGDKDLWIRLGKEMKERNLKGFLVDFITCAHIEEHFTLRDVD